MNVYKERGRQVCTSQHFLALRSSEEGRRRSNLYRRIGDRPRSSVLVFGELGSAMCPEKEGTSWRFQAKQAQSGSAVDAFGQSAEVWK
jgi:hypothetical protein